MATRRVFEWIWAVALVFAFVFAPARAQAATWTPPPLNGHVVDTARALTQDEARALDLKLDAARKQTGFAVVVLILPQLPEGLTIEDVGYAAGNAWGVGSKAGDDGVLLINAVAERKLRIETGKGVGGGLTDIESSHINREVIGPLLKEGRTYDAMNAGTDAILKALVENTPDGKSQSGMGKQTPSQKVPGAGKSAVESASAEDLGQMAIWLVVVVGVIGLAIWSPTFRQILFFFLFFGRGGGGGGGFGGGGGGGGGSGYGGGGGSFGGGGSSDDY